MRIIVSNGSFLPTTHVVQALHEVETNSIVLKGTTDGMLKAHSQLCFPNIWYSVSRSAPVYCISCPTKHCESRARLPRIDSILKMQVSVSIIPRWRYIKLSAILLVRLQYKFIKSTPNNKNFIMISFLLTRFSHMLQSDNCIQELKDVRRRNILELELKKTCYFKHMWVFSTLSKSVYILTSSLALHSVTTQSVNW